MNNKNCYKPPKSKLLLKSDTHYRHKLIMFVLIVMLLSKLMALNLTLGILFPTQIEGIEITTDFFQAGHLIIYFILSTVCIVGILFRQLILFYTLLVIFLLNIGVYIINNTSTFQSVSDPLFIVIFLFLVYFVKPNKWYQSFIGKPI